MPLKAVFDIRTHRKYDSDLSQEFRFQGRSNYLDVAKACVNDWIVFRETTADGGSGAYIAMAQSTGLSPHPGIHNHYCIPLVGFLFFDQPVDLKLDGRYVETSLMEVRRSVQIGSALQGRAMRIMNAVDFDRVVHAGFARPPGVASLNTEWLIAGSGFSDALGQDALKPQPRRLETILTNRRFRDRIFRRQVAAPYNFTCAVTRTRSTNGHGRFEVQAAHLWPVHQDRPDIVQNGLALAASAHWLHENFVFTINPDFTVKAVPELIDPAYLALFPLPGQRIHLPKDDRLWPHAKFLEHHRAEFYKRRG